MLDQIRHQIQARLDELLGEAEKLRHALAALGSRDGAATPSPSAAPAADRARRRTNPAPASRTPARPRASAVAVRTAPGATKTTVLEALSGGSAMTAGEIAAATGLGPRDRLHHALEARQERRADQSRPRLPARRPDSARHAGRCRRERVAERLSQEARHHQSAALVSSAAAVS
jgi:hypothetical protein